MVIKHRGSEPFADSSTFIAPTAVLVGNVHVGPRSRIMYGSILDSEGSSVEIGERTIVCENAVLRATSSADVEHPVLIGDHVFVGPHATLLGCTIEPCCYIATGATVLQGATVHAGAVVAVGALVHGGTVVPRSPAEKYNHKVHKEVRKVHKGNHGQIIKSWCSSCQFFVSFVVHLFLRWVFGRASREFFIPPNTIAIGDPVKLYSPDEKDALAAAVKSVGFTKIAFGVEAQWEDLLSRNRQVAEVRSKEFETHFDDTVSVGEGE